MIVPEIMSPFLGVTLIVRVLLLGGLYKGPCFLETLNWTLEKVHGPYTSLES